MTANIKSIALNNPFRKKIVLFITMSLTVLLPSGSFFLSSYLEKKIAVDDIKPAQLELAIALKLETAYQYILATTQYGSTNWQKYQQLLANKNAEHAYQLATFYQEQHDENQAEFWYQQASQQQHHGAKLALAKKLIKQQKGQQAETLLAELPEHQPTLVLRIDNALRQGDLSGVASLLTKLHQLNNEHELFAIFGHFSILDLLPSVQSGGYIATKISEKPVLACKNSVQFFATNLGDLAYIESLLAQFQKHPLAEFFCFAIPKYQPLAQLNCQHGNEQAILCDESYWGKQAESIDSRYIGVLLPKGGANVHLGIVYLDHEDNVLVLAHELAHLLGFVDEYPLAKNHQACQQVPLKPFANNVAVLVDKYQGAPAVLREKILESLPWAKQIKSTTPIIQSSGSGWILGTPKSHQEEVGVFKSDTCELSTITAYKPLYNRTIMQSFEAKFPATYQAIFKTSSQRYIMPSFEYNIALANFQAGDTVQAKYWLKQAAAKEGDKARQEKVLAGSF